MTKQLFGYYRKFICDLDLFWSLKIVNYSENKKRDIPAVNCPCDVVRSEMESHPIARLLGKELNGKSCIGKSVAHYHRL